MSLKFVDGQTVGVDLGTTYSTISQLNDQGDPIAMVNSDGRTITPSVVLLGDQGHIVVGPSFERISVADPQHIVEAVKRQMGSKDFFKTYQDKKLTPEFISGLILKKLKQDAEAQIGPIGNAVLTVPYYFNDVRRKATQDAGVIAGLNVIDIINEPTAATLAYAWMKGELGHVELGDVERTILVYDLGGGTFDVTVVHYTPTNFRVLATDGDVYLGGLDWSARITDHVAEQFQRKFGIDPREDPETVLQLAHECEQAKRKLSDSAQVPINCYYQGKTLTVAITRGDFERITGDLLQRTRDTTELVIQQANIDPKSLAEVILVGGSTHMPAVVNMLREICGREPSRELNPDEAVSQGAAIHAAILEAKETGGEGRMAQAVIKRLRSVTATDVNSHSLGIVISEKTDKSKKVNHIMIPKNTSIPHSVTQRFTTNIANQQSIHVQLLQGELQDIDSCTPIGDFRVTGLPPNLPAGSPLDVTYSFDANGRILASALEATGKTKASTQIVRDSGLDDAGLQAFESLARQYAVE